MAKTHEMKILASLLTKPNLQIIPGYRSLLSSAFAFSLMTVCVKNLGGRIPVSEIVLIRAIISLVITFKLLRDKKVYPWGINKKLLIIRGILGTLALFCIFQALVLLPLASATTIQYTYPTFTAIGASVLLGEKIKSKLIFAVFTGWIGVTFIIREDWINKFSDNLPLTGVLIALGGALLTSLAYICVKKLSATEHQLVIIYYFPLISIPLTLPFVISNGVLPMGMEWIWLIGIGLLTQLGQLFITRGLTLLPASKATAISYAQVLFSAILGLVLFNESITLFMGIGSLLVFMSTLISIDYRKI